MKPIIILENLHPRVLTFTSTSTFKVTFNLTHSHIHTQKFPKLSTAPHTVGYLQKWKM